MSVRKEVKKIIDEELAKDRVVSPWDMDEIHVLPESNIVIEYSSSKGALSQALIDHFSRPLRTPVTLAHFTSLAKFESIVSTRTLRLHSLLKRVNEHEFRPFAEDFGLKGYLESDDGDPYYRSLMGNLFYTSFTDVDPIEKHHMWDEFGARGKGVKVVFQVSVRQSRSELRRVIYGTSRQASRALIKRLMDRIYAECNRRFIMRGISMVGAFYLPLGYDFDMEDETRLLVKSWGEGPASEMIVGVGDDAYIPLGIGDNANPFCQLSIIAVQVGNRCDKSNVEKILQAAGLPDVRVIDYA